MIALSHSQWDWATIVSALRTAGCVFAEEEATLLISAEQSTGELNGMVERRIAGEPLEQIVGWASFCGLRVAVEPGVFVPRRRTEFLARQAASLVQPGDVVLDLCCGSGAVGTAVLSMVERIDLHLSDIDPVAVRCARRNVGVNAQVYEGDLYAPLPASLRGCIDLLVVNAPYVPTDAIALMPQEARLHEPHTALDGGVDGLVLHRRVAAEAPSWLAPGAHLLMETSQLQAAQTADLFRRNGLNARTMYSDEFDATVVVGDMNM